MCGNGRTALIRVILMMPVMGVRVIALLHMGMCFVLARGVLPHSIFALRFASAWIRLLGLIFLGFGASALCKVDIGFRRTAKMPSLRNVCYCVITPSLRRR